MELVKESLLKAGIITLLLLGIGIIVGMQMDDARIDYLQQEIRSNQLESETFLVTQDYLEDSSQNYCQVTRKRIPQLSARNAQIGRDLQSFSGRSISSAGTFRQLRENYYINQLKLYNVLKNYKQRCGSDVDLVFFFFDNSVASKRQGAVLTEYREKVDNRTHVFSYNINTGDSPILDTLVTDYNVTGAPTIVVNGNRTYRRYVSLKELKEEL